MIPAHFRLPMLSIALVAVACDDAGPGAESFVKRDSAGVEIVENTLPDSAAMTTIAKLPGEQRIMRILSTDQRGYGAESFPSPFAKITQFAAGSERLYVATQDAPQVLVYANDGTLLRIIRTGHQLQPVEQDRLAAWIDNFVGTWPPEVQNDRRQLMRDTPAPESLPAYGALATDAADNLWVKDYFHSVLGPTADWNIYDPDGRLIARIRMPPGLQVHQIGTNWILGVERDDMDVQHVRLYRVSKN